MINLLLQNVTTMRYTWKIIYIFYCFFTIFFVFLHDSVFLYHTHAFSIYFSFPKKEAQLFTRSPRLKVQRRTFFLFLSFCLFLSPLVSCFLLVDGIFVCCLCILVARSLIEATVLGRDISRSPP